jgi:phytoene desaturase (3,4-didehydrolycopene-forming)
VGMYLQSHATINAKCLREFEGAGVGGVATAARLAKAGFEVTVLEKNGFTGGRCSLIHREGYV